MTLTQIGFPKKKSASRVEAQIVKSILLFSYSSQKSKHAITVVLDPHIGIGPKFESLLWII